MSSAPGALNSALSASLALPPELTNLPLLRPHEWRLKECSIVKIEPFPGCTPRTVLDAVIQPLTKGAIAQAFDLSGYAFMVGRSLYRVISYSTALAPDAQAEVQIHCAAIWQAPEEG